MRRFEDPAHVEASDTLAGLRELIDTLGEQIAGLLAQRALYLRDATRFKRDAFQLAAPARRAQVLKRVRKLAVRHNAGMGRNGCKGDCAKVAMPGTPLQPPPHRKRVCHGKSCIFQCACAGRPQLNGE